MAIKRAWREAHEAAFGAANKDMIVATNYMSASKMCEMLGSDAPHKLGLMSVQAKKGLFAFALMGSRSPYFLHVFFQLRSAGPRTAQTTS